ncbi:hypothetical protein [Massilia sp. TS11]|uniref:hypothetical protein n=1 Tax=Massilia sp. TS11 TaxID=2908003 RepID=UPI001EDC2B19|nr:hypothetical protein [Massilia sp. TS11]MCG2583911.1 hypothetical protein [Massilia sp. TS11]
MNLRGTRAPKPATLTLLNTIRKTAKTLARSGMRHKVALDLLAREAGYMKGWEELKGNVFAATVRGAGLSIGEEPTLLRGPRASVPNWERDESELKEWFERPYLKLNMHGDAYQIICLDGRIWNNPSLITDCHEDPPFAESIEFAKERFSFFFANSIWKVEPDINSSEHRKLTLCWRHTEVLTSIDREPLFIGTPDQVHRRERVLREIRQRRIRDFDRLFKLEALGYPAER